MTTYFVSRHAGAKEWAAAEGIVVDYVIEHLEVDTLQVGDKVLGSLPVNLVAELNANGIRYFHLSLNLPAQLRGQEISVEIMQKLGAKLEEFRILKL